MFGTVMSFLFTTLLLGALTFVVYFTIRVVIFAGACYGLYWFLTR